MCGYGATGYYPWKKIKNLPCYKAMRSGRYPMDVQKLSIIIVHYNQLHYLALCLDSLSRCTLPEGTRLIVIDNASCNRAALKRICSTSTIAVKLVINSENLGLARAANKAFNFVKSEYVLNLNPDIQVCKNSIQDLILFLDKNPRSGIAFPKLLNADKTLQYSCRSHYNLLTIVLRRSFFQKIYNGPRIRNHLMADWDHKKIREIDWALGAAFLVRRTALEKGSLFDDRYFLYMEDVDLCLTLRRRGWKIHYVPSSVMVHHHQQTSRALPLSRANVEHFKSFLRFQMKHCFPKNRI